ncbi:hypothetical protein D1610_12170 [Sphingomonas gilva]|uniref:PAS domain-containing protein n=1 Tax=Sphingomonas gilva TaxID=2305907 RepID=A0A396RLN8_9SPHN|nr:PAS domain-containing protein [Sphingomonas gilva]RHW17287.1 hypothetical protein D1610_12170 [Sphingomonas gilva]
MRHDPVRAESVTVSATHFVRHFSELRRNAERGPVYIENHGKTGWALLSAGLLDALAQGATGDVMAREAERRFDALMDALTTRVLLLDDDLRLIRANAAARRHLGIGDEALGAAVTALLPRQHGELIGDAVARTRDSGTTESFEIDSALYPARALRVVTMRMPAGVALIVDDLGDPGALRSVTAEIGAMATALRALPASGFGSINLRGAIDDADSSLVVLSGAAPAQLVGARLGTLFDVATRAVVNDLIERALGGGEAGSTHAAMLLKGENPRPVTIALAPRRGRQGIGGASFVIVAGGDRGAA